MVPAGIRSAVICFTAGTLTRAAVCAATFDDVEASAIGTANARATTRRDIIRAILARTTPPPRANHSDDPRAPPTRRTTQATERPTTSDTPRRRPIVLVPLRTARPPIARLRGTPRP